MMTDKDVLKKLDWTAVGCQCEITRYCQHRGRPCFNTANRQVEFHAIDRCNEPELGEFGNYVFLLCEACLNTLALNVEAHVRRLNEFGRALCLTCGGSPARSRHQGDHRTMICVNAQILGFATVMLPTIGVIIGLLLAGRRR